MIKDVHINNAIPHNERELKNERAPELAEVA
jgi:hypothetical protein